MYSNDELKEVLRKVHPEYIEKGKRGEKWIEVRNYDTVIYPEHYKDLEELYDCIRSFGVPCSLSPLHDKDLKDKSTGELKKAHYHLVCQYSGKTTPFAFYKHLCSAFGDDGFFGIHVPNTIEQGVRYHIHLDNPEKYQYNLDEVIDFNGFSSKGYLIKGGNIVDDFCVLMDLIDEKNMIFYNDLLKYLRANDTILFQRIISSQKLDAKIHKYMRSREHQMMYDGEIEVKKVQSVNSDGSINQIFNRQMKVV